MNTRLSTEGSMPARKNKFVTKWIKALKSEEFKQGKGRLTHAGRFCCLGVACKISDLPRSEWVHERNLQDGAAQVGDLLGLQDSLGSFNKGAFAKKPGAHNLAYLNDDGVSFAEIAKFIASNPPGLFQQDGPNEDSYEDYDDMGWGEEEEQD
jgi:hypothetical protein